ncbi:serine/threonine-protein kinase [Roseofilum sp. BLCC_M154]|uniref:Serine/threonine-protein kinase n=1 Tax=Roseofilum acuticapitatum BLCC-M154 TaxID=3022444 RepID=A0ABT7AVE7_9CYAN|nr:serine/threonine-protein kinase [Roseofilum acuticapitatum]MDJ1170882.1 serine/threonine-protein kinase [Roseofilum acuticapitatum BLCC-M154]
MYWTRGERIGGGRYEIVDELGQGGFGLTYQAKHCQLGSFCVIKAIGAWLRKQRNYDRFVERFRDEGRRLAELAQQKPHPHIVRVFDLFREPHQNYPGFEIDCLVMDFIAGDTLEMAVYQSGKLPETEAVRYVRQIGDALIEVHKRGLVHWDVTPMNIMIRPQKEAVLIDFGIAGDCPPSSFSRKFGNEAFAPYEQLMLGEREKQCDIYTLGASLYYAVTQQVPTLSNARKLDNEPLIEPIRLEKSISSQVNDAIIWAMALEPGDRPQSMEEWLKSFSDPFSGEEEDDLRSDKEVDYRYLQQLLQQQQWKEADMETARRMLEVAGREEQGWLDVEDIDNFPCTDLRTIDRLWVKYSKGQFGFSVQKKIYQSLGGTREYNAEIWRNFGDRVGWREKGEWMDYNDLTFSLSIKGHLPGVVGWWMGWGSRLSLLSRRDL